MGSEAEQQEKWLISFSEEEVHYLSSNQSPTLPWSSTEPTLSQPAPESQQDAETCTENGKVQILIPDSQSNLKNELVGLRSQLQAQTKAFEFLNHSVMLLEKESSLQQLKIQQLEDALSLVSCSAQEELLEHGLEQGLQELWGALGQRLQELGGNDHYNKEPQHQQCSHSLQQLAQEIHDSKVFLWEELKTLQDKVAQIHQKLTPSALPLYYPVLVTQEEEITQNFINIKKMQDNMVKCRKFLTKLKEQSGLPLAEDLAGSKWAKEVEKELKNIRLNINTLQNGKEQNIQGILGTKGTGQRGRHCRSPTPSTSAWTLKSGTTAQDESSAED
ncbi:coiled-coil domain-containing protein 159 isoform X2 [Tachyglossus aculeatus]|uniref:coiled-coil domain-containing protein 159 isoform X2 n=1 Tax=Tachyglossus aculeatus TaxID=9261 RepID=UPI0018F728A8|nr:coiled-coil domain-containing protein 159 isoform X2 [Tachyglossus aculeatus]